MGQNVLLSIAAVILLGSFLVAANGLLSDNMRIASEDEYILTALTLEQSIIDEVKTKAFDQATVSTPVNSTSALSVPGIDGGESIPNPDVNPGSGFLSATKFNDVDDYNGYARIVNTPRAGTFTLSVTVCYASETSPDSAAAGKTFCKRMTVSATNPLLTAPVSLQYIFVY